MALGERGRRVATIAGATSWHATGALRGVAAQRSRLHLCYRLGARAYLFATGRPTERQRHAAVAGAGVDALVWAVLRRTDRLLFGPRLVLDLVDASATSLLLDGSAEPATLVGVPLAMEAGIRSGPASLAVPAAHLVVTTAVRRCAGRKTSPTIFVWQAMGAGMGMLLSWYERREHDATVSGHGQNLAAERSAAWLAGQSSVALGADSVVDELARLEYLLGAASGPVGETGSGQALRAWKSALSSTTADRAVYLGTLLCGWSRSRQGAELAQDVQFGLSPGEGTTILSSAQAQALINELDRLGLSGAVTVRVRQRPAQALPGDPVVLRIGHHEVTLPKDPASALRPFDPAPLVVLAGGLWCLGLSSPNHGGAPWAATIPGAAATVPLALWCHRAIDRQGPGAPEQVVLRSIGHALVVALVVTPFLSAPFDDEGAQVFPATMTLLSASVLSGRYEQTFSPAARRRVLAAALVALGVSLVPARRPIRWGALAAGVVELATVYVSFNRVQFELDRSGDELARELAQQRDREREEAFLAGRQLVLELVGGAADQARRRLASDRSGLPPAVADQATERLDLVDKLLAELS